MKLTPEQVEIIKTEIPYGQLLKVKAFAGCAKTTTLREYTKARPDKSFLYIAFNTTVAAEARRTFPTNVTSKTIHALAYAQYGFMFKEKLGYLKPFVLTEELQVKNYSVGKYLIDVMVKFLTSDDKEIKNKHLVLNPDQTEEQFIASKEASTITYLLKKANDLWEAMQDPLNKKVPMTHDGYLKLYQLSEPELDYDYILLDEAHDTNDVTLDVFMRQKCSKILVGDTHQSIYEFRHSYDAVGTTVAHIDKYLSTSFRFGDGIAAMANSILGNVKNEAKPIKGFQPSDLIGRVDQSKPYVIVARTNGFLFSEAAELVSQIKPKPFGFIGTREEDGFSPFKPYYFDRILDIYYLYAGQKSQVKDTYIKRFASFASFMNIINDKEAPDVELIARADVVEKYQHHVPSLIEAIVENSCNPEQAHILFTTAHKSKGLEWPQVKLTNDYIDLVRQDKDGIKKIITLDTPSKIQEVNLVYVAATRAQETLQINGSINELVKLLEARKQR